MLAPWQLVEHIESLVDPATLLVRLVVHYARYHPET